MLLKTKADSDAETRRIGLFGVKNPPFPADSWAFWRPGARSCRRSSPSAHPPCKPHAARSRTCPPASGHHGLPPQVHGRDVARRSPAPITTPFKPGGHDNLEVPCFKDDMSARASEAFVLQTYPFKEGDLIVSFLTRDLGKLRGVARRARRPKGGFGSASSGFRT